MPVATQSPVAARDDIIDGDAALQVRISVRTNPADPSTEIGSSDLMEHQYLHTGPAVDPVTGALNTGNLTGPTLQADVFAGNIDPGNLVVVREIIHPANGSAVETAVFAGPQSNYSVTVVGNTTTVTQTGANVVGQKISDGIDTLRHVEVLQFSDSSIAGAPSAPTIGTATAGNTTATVTFAAPANAGTSPITSFEIVVRNGTTVVNTITGIPASATSYVVTGLTNGTSYNYAVHAVNASGVGADSATSNTVIPAPPAVAPGAPTIGTATGGNTSATVNWTAPVSNGGSPITGYSVRVVNAANVQVGALRPAAAGATSLVVTGLTNGTAYRFQVSAINAIGTGTASALSNTSHRPPHRVHRRIASALL